MRESPETVPKTYNRFRVNCGMMNPMMSLISIVLLMIAAQKIMRDDLTQVVEYRLGDRHG